MVCGHYHSMALSADHRVWSWGWGVHGQLGVGSIEDVLLPTHVAALDEYEVTQLAAGYSHSAALTTQVSVETQISTTTTKSFFNTVKKIGTVNSRYSGHRQNQDLVFLIE